MYYDKQGNRISLEEMANLHQDMAYRTIKQEALPNGKWVSTVWLGTDHRFGDGPPLIFETMIFPRKGDWLDEACRRYSTEEDARQGHADMVREYGYTD